MVISVIHPPAANPFTLLLGGRAHAAPVECTLRTPDPVMRVASAVIAVPVLFRPHEQFVQFLLGQQPNLFLLRCLGFRRGFGVRVVLLATHYRRPRPLRLWHFGCCGGGRHSWRGQSIVPGTQKSILSNTSTHNHFFKLGYISAHCASTTAFVASTAAFAAAFVSATAAA